jgi:outer membrane biosynthesis protein TonB
MNSKIVLAFLGGAAVAGALAFLLASKTPPVAQATGNAEPPPITVVERPVAEASAADVAAAMEPVKPTPIETVRRNTPLPKPAPVVNQTPKTADVPREVAQTPSVPAPIPTPAPVAPPTPTPNPAPQPEPKRAEVFRPDPVAKPAPARTPETVTIPQGTSITVRLGSTIHSERNEVGDTFTATVDTPIVINDIVLAERGARVQGKVVAIEKSGRVKGTASVSLALTSITLSDGQKIEIVTDPWVREAASSKKNDAVKVGVMAGIGAAIGAIAGGGKGAAVGAASGAGAGTGVVLATKGKPAQVDVETRIPFRLANATTVTERIP